MKELTPEQLMNERPIGLLVRGYASRSEDVRKRVEMMHTLVKKALSATVVGKPFLKQVDILVWANQKDYPDEADCGELAPALRRHFQGERRIRVHEVTSGDPFCMILNHGVALQLRSGCDYSVVASAEANAYWSSDVPSEMVRLAGLGARAVGVAINELTDSVKEGRIANTMALWHNLSLLTCSGFDPRAQKPKNDKEAHYLKGIDWDGNERYYHLGGVEEVIPLARLVDTFGRCIGVIESTDPRLRYQLPDQVTDPEAYRRHMAKFGTKTERQLAHLLSIGRDFSHLRGGVMSA